MYQALELAFRGAAYAHKIDNAHYLSYSYFTMGLIQNEILDFENAEEHLLTALKYAEQTNEKVYLPYILHCLGAHYHHANKDYDNAIFYYQKAVQLAKESAFVTNYQTPMINMIWTYLDLEKFTEAAQHIEEVDQLIATSTAPPLDSNMAALYIAKARLFTHQGILNKAIELFDKAEQLIERINYWPKGKSFIYTYRSEAYEQLQNFPKVIEDLKKLQENERSIFDNAKLKNQEVAKIKFKVKEYQQKLEANRKEKILLMDIARNNKIIIYISITGCIFLFGIFFFYYRGYISKKRTSEILAQKNLELSEAKNHAEKLSKVKSQFISTISHELRTPLYGVIGICSILKENNQSEKDQKLLNSLSFSADHLLNLVNKVLKVSKISNKEITLDTSPVNLVQLATNILASFEYQSEQKQNQLRLEYDHTIPNLVEIDSLRISEVLINLIGNAIKFTDNGMITLRTKLLSKNAKTVSIRFEIEDNGIGIPNHQKEYVFEEFTQLEASVFEDKKGTGLGLSIVKKIVQLMGSTIQLKDTTDVGCTFFFDVEVAISSPLTIDIDNPKLSQLSDPLSAKILIAEDNKINQVVTKKLLQNISCESLIAENGHEAVEMLKKEKFDLVLMDINMPVLDGMQATLQIREFNKKTPIIALTASELSEVEDACRNAGMNDLINKPLSKEELKFAIESHLQAG